MIPIFRLCLQNAFSLNPVIPVIPVFIYEDKARFFEYVLTPQVCLNQI